MNRIDALLGGTTIGGTTPVVYRGEPFAINQSPCIAFWLNGREDKAVTITNAGSVTTFTIRVYFRLQASADVRENVEEDLWDACYDIEAALLGDANLSGNVSDSRVGSQQAGYVDLGGLAFRTATLPYEVDILEDVTIAP
jgi:hypothetical protein